MTTPDQKKPQKISRLCPECEKDVELTIDSATGDREGRCSNCGLDVGAALNRHRASKALKKLEKEEEERDKPPKKESSWF